MKPSLLYFYVLFLSLFFLTGNTLSKSKEIKPVKFKSKLVILESGKKKIYYPVEQKDPVVLSLKGPGKLHIITRALIKDKNNVPGNYSVHWTLDGGKLYDILIKNIKISSRSKFQLYTDDFSTINKNINIVLTPGEHTIQIYSGNDTPEILTRFLFTKTKEKKVKWVMLSPSISNEPVDLVTHENVVHYYRFSEKIPLKIKINGPTYLRVLTRFENHYNMKGRINYRLELKENGKLIHTYLLSSMFSDVTTYKNENSKMPGKAREFYIDVPKGKHTYTIVPIDKDKNSILARVLFPKKDVKLEE
jgi:hypothetical protein